MTFMHETDGYRCHGGCPGKGVKIPEILTQNPGNALKNYGMYVNEILLRSDLVAQSHPWSHLTEISSRQRFKASLRKTGSKMWPLHCKQYFIKIWPSDLLFDPIPPIIELDWNIIKTNILSKFEEDCINTVAPRL